MQVSLVVVKLRNMIRHAFDVVSAYKWIGKIIKIGIFSSLIASTRGLWKVRQTNCYKSNFNPHWGGIWFILKNPGFIHTLLLPKFPFFPTNGDNCFFLKMQWAFEYGDPRASISILDLENMVHFPSHNRFQKPFWCSWLCLTLVLLTIKLINFQWLRSGEGTHLLLNVTITNCVCLI